MACIDPHVPFSSRGKAWFAQLDKPGVVAGHQVMRIAAALVAACIASKKQ